jgi:mannose-1-phosphate guanylyltransferase / mannose-6-phosphate isomerase
MTTIYPVILSGGSGTRLWPLSRAMYPKQFIRFFNDQPLSFLGATVKRLAPSLGFAAPTLLCNNDHRFLVADDLAHAGVQARAIILEPVARNTAAAIAVAALSVRAEDPTAVMVVMPSDHAITDGAKFAEAVARASVVAATSKLVLFGITPDQPETGYGYIRKGGALAGAEPGAFKVAAFVEKPNLATAEQYLASGEYFWNSGIFVLHAQTFLDELKRLNPAVLAAAEQSLAKATTDLGFVHLNSAEFAKSPSISVDYAVMEKTTAAAMLPISVGWSDVGSWSSMWSLAARDKADNFVRTPEKAVLEDTHHCYIHSDGRLITTIGVDNLVIVDTPDALLIADKSRTQEVGTIVNRLKTSGGTEHIQHVRNTRPWGYFQTLSLGSRFQVKLLHVKPGGKLSVQMHHHRSEHWIVVSGTAKVLLGETEKFVFENESIYIRSTEWHRLENPGKVPLELIEVQTGSYFGEDDIVRRDDVYHRAPDETK